MRKPRGQIYFRRGKPFNYNLEKDQGGGGEGTAHVSTTRGKTGVTLCSTPSGTGSRPDHFSTNTEQRVLTFHIVLGLRIIVNVFFLNNMFY
jgi:hypothetical protein